MVKIFSDLNELNFFAAEKFVSAANTAIEENGKFTLALAGGSTPKSLYKLLASDKYKNQIEWAKVFFFFGDERDVPPESEESNFRMANENLLKPLQINEKNIFRWQTEIENPSDTAEKYELAIKDFFNLRENAFPRFDLILLGIGEDGHTASLFPFTEALNETNRIAVANPVEKLNAVRLTFTFPTINNAANVIFLVSGEQKADVLPKVLQGERQPEKYPAQAVQPKNGNLFWLIESRAARLLK